MFGALSFVFQCGMRSSGQWLWLAIVCTLGAVVVRAESHGCVVTEEEDEEEEEIEEEEEEERKKKKKTVP